MLAKRLAIIVGTVAVVAAAVIVAAQFRSKTTEPGGPEEHPPDANVRGPIFFDDVTAKAGIRFEHFDSASPSHFVHESLGSGVAWIDYDNDGWPDLLFIQDGPLPGSATPQSPRRMPSIEISATAHSRTSRLKSD